MAYQKFKLNERNEYQLAQATRLSVDLLADCENGHCEDCEIGTEVLDAGPWDDISVFSRRGSRNDVIRWQIKSQRTPIPSDTLRHLLASAANLLEQDDPWEEFRLALPSLNITVSGINLEIRKLGELCDCCQGAGNPHEQIAANPENLPEEALRSWYTFVSDAIPDHVAAASLLLRLKVVALGSLDDLRNRTEATLASWYQDASAARQAIEGVLRSQTNPFSRLRYEHLSKSLEGLERIEGSPPWCSFHHGDNGWVGRGPISNENIIQQFWIEGGASEIRLLTASRADDHVSSVLVRLALHANQGVSLACVDRDTWRDHARQVTGGTLGDSDTGRIDAIFPPECHRDPTEIRSTGRTLATANLQARMHQATWDKAVRQVEETLASLFNHESLTDEAREAWQDLRDTIAPPSPAGRALFRQGLRTDFEPQSIDGEVRCGPRTSPQIAKALLLLVALRIVFKEQLSVTREGMVGVQAIGVRIVATSTCFDPAKGRVRELVDVLTKLAYSGRILILGACEQPVAALRDLLSFKNSGTFAASEIPTYATARPEPDIVFSWAWDTRRALESGKASLVDWVRRVIQDATKAHRDALSNTLDAIETEEEHAA